MIELAPRSKIKLNHDYADLYVMTCYHDNKSDWRLPTTIETEKHLSKTAHLTWASDDILLSYILYSVPVRNL